MMGLKGTIQQAATFETIEAIYDVLQPHFPTMGACRMVTVIRKQYSIQVSEYDHFCSLQVVLDLTRILRKLINEFLHYAEPEAVEKHKRSKFKQRRFWSAGIMEYWSIDQHDKWRRFRLWLHLGVDPFSGCFVWLKVWWSNRNACLLINYYLEAVRMTQGAFFATSTGIFIS